MAVAAVVVMVGQRRLQSRRLRDLVYMPREMSRLGVTYYCWLRTQKSWQAGRTRLLPAGAAADSVQVAPMSMLCLNC